MRFVTPEYLRSRRHRSRYMKVAAVYAGVQLIIFTLIAPALMHLGIRADVSGCNAPTDVAGQLFYDANADGLRGDAILNGASGSLDSTVGGTGTTVGNGIDGRMFPTLSIGGDKISSPASFWGPRVAYSPINPNLPAKFHPLSGVTATVKLYNSSNSEVANLTTNSAGEWRMANFAASLPVRVEYSGLPTGYSFSGSIDGTMGPRHFITSPGCDYDSGFYYTTDYCQDNPYIALACNFGAGATGNTVQRLSYNAAERLNDVDNNGVRDSSDATASNAGTTKLPSSTTGWATNAQTGPIWGLAYQKQSRQLFASAVVAGTGGLLTEQTRAIVGGFPINGLYKIDTTQGSPSASLFYGPSGGGGGSTYPTSIGTGSFGGMDFSDDGASLYLTQLFNKNVVKLDMTGITTTSPTVTQQTDIAIPDPGCSGGGGDTYRPFGLKFWHGMVYVGTVCTRQQKGFIQQYNGSWSTVVTTNLADVPKIGGTLADGGLYTDLGYYAPFFITGLDFDTDGSIIIGTSAGPGHTDFAQGEVYQIPRSGIGYGTPTPFQAASQDFFNNVGGLAILPGSGQVITAAENPSTDLSNGLAWLNTSSGSVDKKYSLYRTVASPSYDGTLASSNAVGDIALICDQAPYRATGRVWSDANNNGIEDPGEAGLAGVTVNLLNGSDVTIGTVQTNSAGYWGFGGTGNVNLTSGQSLAPGNTYKVRFDNPPDFLTGGPLFDSVLATTNAPGSTSLIDNDAISVSNYPQVSFTPSSTDNLLYSFDTGVYIPAAPTPTPTPSPTPTPTPSPTPSPPLPPGSGSSGGDSGPSTSGLGGTFLGDLLPDTGASQRAILVMSLGFLFILITTVGLTENHFRRQAAHPKRYDTPPMRAAGSSL